MIKLIMVFREEKKICLQHSYIIAKLAVMPLASKDSVFSSRGNKGAVMYPTTISMLDSKNEID